jgi:protein-disulfide isomerase
MMRLVIGIVMGVAAAAIAVTPAAAQPFSAQQKQEIDELIHDYLQKHPEAIIQSLRAAQAKIVAERLAQQRKALVAKSEELLHDPNSPVGGNPNGNVTLVEFFDYRCPYCKAIEPWLETLIKEDGNLRVVYKEFPILGPVSIFASRVAIAAQKQGKYVTFHDRMMALRGAIDDNAVLEVAKDCGLDMKKLKADMASAETKTIIQSDYALANALGIDATPGLVVGDRITMGAIDIEGLRKLIAAARQNKKAM